jgi:hypothetical protein
MLKHVYLSLFRLNRKMLLVLTALFIVPSVAPFLGMLLFFTLLNVLLWTEIKNHTDLLYRSLPVRPSTVVNARYLAAFSIAVAVQVLGYVLYLLLIRREGVEISGFFTNREGIAYFTAALTAFYLPAYHLFGYLGGMVVCLVSMGGFTVLLSGLLYVYLSLSTGTWVLDHYAETGGNLWLLVPVIFKRGIAWMGIDVFRIFIICLLVLLMWSSYRLSIRFFGKKDI